MAKMAAISQTTLWNAVSEMNGDRDTDMDSCILTAGRTLDYLILLGPSEAYMPQ